VGSAAGLRSDGNASYGKRCVGKGGIKGCVVSQWASVWEGTFESGSACVLLGVVSGKSAAVGVRSVMWSPALAPAGSNGEIAGEARGGFSACTDAWAARLRVPPAFTQSWLKPNSPRSSRPPDCRVASNMASGRLYAIQYCTRVPRTGKGLKAS
jgi:hypothetical protein